MQVRGLEASSAEVLNLALGARNVLATLASRTRPKGERGGGNIAPATLGSMDEI
jgi:hypothetical protein